jgi:hypothetical protein
MERISDEWSRVIRGVEIYDESPGLSRFTVNDQLFNRASKTDTTMLGQTVKETTY